MSSVFDVFILKIRESGMERRGFIKIGVAGLGAAIITPSETWAEKPKKIIVSDIYYTQDSPGRWSEKVAGHLPSIGIEKQEGKVIVKVVTAHEMKGYEHYIVKHVLLDKDFKFMDEYLFNPTKDKAAMSSFTLSGYSGDLHVLSMCNKHDLWLNSAKI
jgi:superoxide reductase